jgi:glycine/D-amino acid oxidase-like deaminating enzyme
MIDELLPFVQEVYRQIGRSLGGIFLGQKDLVDFFPTPQMRVAFLKRYEEDPQYLKLPGNDHAWDDHFRYDFGYGVISPCWLVDLPALLAAWRKRMQVREVLLEERFDRDVLIVENEKVRYKNILAERVIFCDGIESYTNPYFSLLPFAPNKGEALVVDIPGLSNSIIAGNQEQSAGEYRTIFKKGITLAPWKEGLYWIGSSYEWSFDHEQPTETFRVRTELTLREWLKAPFKTVDHIASVRPATLERRPFVGFHPKYPSIGILNGMGTKGCSLAPYFAHQLVEHITKGMAIQPDADVRRFSGVLKRN